MKRELKFSYMEEQPELEINEYISFLTQLKNKKGPYFSHFEDWDRTKDEIKEPFSSVTIGGHFIGMNGKHRDHYVRLKFIGQTLLFDENGIADSLYLSENKRKLNSGELGLGDYDLFVESDSKDAVIDIASLLLPDEGMREHIEKSIREKQ